MFTRRNSEAVPGAEVYAAIQHWHVPLDTPDPEFVDGSSHLEETIPTVQLMFLSSDKRAAALLVAGYVVGDSSPRSSTTSSESIVRLAGFAAVAMVGPFGT